VGFFVSLLSIHIHCLSNEVHRFEVHTPYGRMGF